MLITGNEIVCPQGTPGAAPLVINLAAILKAEARQEEVATVNAMKAPELLKTLNRSWLDLSETLSKLYQEKGRAVKAAEKRKAVLVLEVVPKTLADKKLASNEANREAVISLDTEYEELEDKVLQITAVMKFLEGKLHSFENAFSSVKKILGNDQPYMRGGGNSNLSGTTEGPGPSRSMVSRSHNPDDVKDEMGVATPIPRSTPSGFGKARSKF